MSQGSDPATLALTGQLPFILILAILIAGVASAVLLGSYRRSVARAMGRSGGGKAADRPAPSAAAAAATGNPRPLEVVELAGRTELPRSPQAESLFREAMRSPWRIAAVYAAGGFTYAMLLTVAFLVATETELLPVRFAVLFWVFAWPVVPTVRRVAAGTRRAKLAIPLAYFSVLALLGVAAVVRSPGFDPLQLAVLWGVMNLPGTVLLFLFLNRRVRAVGPIVLIFTLIAVAGSNLTLSAAGSSDRVLRGVVAVGSALGLGGTQIFVGLVLLGFAVFGVLGGRFAVGLIRRRYERHRLSDQSLTVDASWLLFAIAHPIGLAFEAPSWVLAGLVSFAAYKGVTSAGFAVLRRTVGCGSAGARLLLLRVFALGKRSERLFDSLEMHWRPIGEIRLISGPDLATTTVEPHEFLDFIAGRLDRRFIDGADALERRFGEIDPAPDHDGRHRVHDFFCYDDAWRTVLARLAESSEVVLMDLRSFSRGNAGCLYEIEQLINLVPLDRVVVLVDGSTDEVFLRERVAEFWGRMTPASPNFGGAEPGRLTIVRLGRAPDRKLAALVGVLCAATGADRAAARRERALASSRSGRPVLE